MVPGPSLKRRRRARGDARRGALAAMLGVAVVVLSGCSREEAMRFGWPAGITVQAQKMRELWTGSVIAALIVGVLVWGLIFWVVVRYRARGEDTVPPQTRYNLPIEVLYTVLPFLIIAVLFYYTAIAETFVDKETKNPDVTIGVVAFKWNWEFDYTGHNDKSGQVISTVGSSDQIPILVVPSGKTIRFTESSRDVIHSFWVPDILFKRDVIPNADPKKDNSFEITINPGKEGPYVGRCAELCGTYHAFMNFELRVVTPDKYDAYLTARADGLSTADALTKIGEKPLATTTTPFNTSRTSRQAS